MIFLTGMPGAGKTYWGRKVADAYGYDFLDLDTYIEKKEKATIATLFEIHGEEGFRDKENRYLEQAIRAAGDDTIIACGGGTPCFYNNMDMMLRAGTVIYLQATIPYLVHNLEQETVQRPLLKNKTGLEQKLAALLAERQPDYERAHHILQTSDISLATFGKIITHV